MTSAVAVSGDLWKARLGYEPSGKFPSLPSGPCRTVRGRLLRSLTAILLLLLCAAPAWAGGDVVMLWPNPPRRLIPTPQHELVITDLAAGQGVRFVNPTAESVLVDVVPVGTLPFLGNALWSFSVPPGAIGATVTFSDRGSVMWRAPVGLGVVRFGRIDVR